MQNHKDANSEKPKKEADKKETISELAHRHLRDENHTTSDEELRNAKVEFSEAPEVGEDNLFEVDNNTLTADNSEGSKESDDANDDKDNPPNPYVVLNPE